jgi:hypothetical protein
MDTQRSAHPAFYRSCTGRFVLDPTRFDRLSKRFAATPFTRSQALRGLAASAVALVGGSLVTEPAAARKHHIGRDPKRKVCHCGDNNPLRIGCVTRTLPKDRVERHLQRHTHDGKGKCCAGKRCATDTGCCPGMFCGDGRCRPMGSCIVQAGTCPPVGYGGFAGPICCTGACRSSGAGNTGTCVACGTFFDTCSLYRDAPADQCCAPRSCADTGVIAGQGLCCSLVGEPCAFDPPTMTQTCCGRQAGVLCPTSGLSAGRCCVGAGTAAPDGCPAGGMNSGCCNGVCDVGTELCT